MSGRGIGPDRTRIVRVRTPAGALSPFLPDCMETRAGVPRPVRSSAIAPRSASIAGSASAARTLVLRSAEPSARSRATSGARTARFDGGAPTCLAAAATASPSTRATPAASDGGCAMRSTWSGMAPAVTRSIAGRADASSLTRAATGARSASQSTPAHGSFLDASFSHSGDSGTRSRSSRNLRSRPSRVHSTHCARHPVGSPARVVTHVSAVA